jgi:adenylate cyclase
MSLYDELKRRSVFRVAIGYIGVSWLVIQVIETLFSIYGVDESIARVVVTVLAIGFIPAMILAWIFELTPEGLKRDAETDRDTPAMRDFGRRVDRVIIAVLSVALIFFAVDKFWPLSPEPGPSIAVLPFANASADPEQDHFAAGITTQLRTMLTGVRELRVMARNTVDFYVDGGGGPQAMFEQHGLAHILEGSVQTVGNRVRITATLVDLAQGTQVWSETFDREMHDVFAIQDEIAAAVVAQLNFGNSRPETRTARELDIEAYKLYLRAEQLVTLAQRGNEDEAEVLQQAIPMLEQALDIEPDFVEGWLTLAKAAIWLERYLAGEQADDMLALYTEAHGQAKRLDPDHPIVLAWQAAGDFFDGDDTQAIAKMFERAIEAAPTTPDVIRPARQFVMSIGRFDKALAMAELAVDRDPKCPDCWYVLSQVLRDIGRPGEAEDAAEIATALGMDLRFSIAKTQLYQHNPDGMLALIEDDDAEQWSVQSCWGYSMAFYTAGRMVEFDDAFAKLRNEYGNVAPLEVAMVYAWSGDIDAAFEWLERTIEPNPYELQLEYLSPFFFKLRGDPRWDGMLRRIERHPEQLAKIRFDPKIPVVNR